MTVKLKDCDTNSTVIVKDAEHLFFTSLPFNDGTPVWLIGRCNDSVITTYLACRYEIVEVNA